MENFKEGFVTLNYVPTHIMTWGGWIEDASKSNWKEIILMFPGNPGVTLYYSEFLYQLYKKYKVPVWIVSHAGSELPPHDRLMPGLDQNLHLYGVEGQIKNKKEFISQYVPKGCKIHLLGHSVGAYISLQLLKDDKFAERVQKAYLLFPVLENIANTPNGRFFNKLVVHFLWLVYFLAGIFHSLPSLLGLLLISIYFRIWGSATSSVVKAATMQLINPKVLRAVFYLAIDEMVQIKDLDADLISKRKDKIFVYYGDHDRWAPVSHYENLVKAVPGVQAQVCKKGLDHAFMLVKPSHLMAEVLEDLIDRDKQK